MIWTESPTPKGKNSPVFASVRPHWAVAASSQETGFRRTFKIYPKDYKSFYYKDTCICMFTAALFTITDLEPTQMPSVIDWIKKRWHIYTMEYYAAIKNDELVSFVGTWMNLETIILSKLTQEQKMKHHMFSLIGGCWTMRTHGHMEVNIIHFGLLWWGTRGGSTVGWGTREGIALVEIPNVHIRVMDAANHHGMCIPM